MLRLLNRKAPDNRPTHACMLGPKVLRGTVSGHAASVNVSQ
jgi:hypothetical protein